MARKRHNNIDLSRPASRHPIAADELVRLLQDTAASLYPADRRYGRHATSLRIRHNALLDATRKFEAFLSGRNIATVNIDEGLLKDFSDDLAAMDISADQCRIYRFSIHKIVNRLPKSYLQRELLTMAEAKRENRFSKYTDATQEAFEHFLKNGKKLRRGSTHLTPILSSEFLSENFRKQIIDSTLTFLNAIQCNDILSVTEQDVEKYIKHHEEKNDRRTAVKTLDYIRPLFSNLRCRGLMKADPLCLVPRTKSNANLDYVDQESINKLADLSTVDMDDFVDVRGRLLCFTLDYDYALRNKESSLVCCSDFHGVELRLPRSIQKVKKDTLPIYSYFPDVSGPLLKRYLELRAMKNPEADILVISLRGTPLGRSGCEKAVRQHCDMLAIKTHEGKPVAPHRLRHSFGTLNIEPLGLSLPLQEIKEQLRHSSIQMTYDVYIGKNPLHKRLSYDKRMERINGSGERKHQSVVSSQSSPEPTPVQDQLVDENEALRQLRFLKLNYRSLRKYALKEGKASKGRCGVVYSSSFIYDLAENYFTRAEAIDLLKMPRATFYDWTKQEAIDFILIGKVSLFRKDVIMQRRRTG